MSLNAIASSENIEDIISNDCIHVVDHLLLL